MRKDSLSATILKFEAPNQARSSLAGIERGRGALTFPKCTSSNTTSSGCPMPQNLVTKAKAVIIVKASL